MFYGMISTFCVGIVMFYISFFHGSILAGMFTRDKEVLAAATDFLKSYAIDCALVGFNFNMIGYLNGCGKTLFVSLQGILSTFLVRIPVSFFMSKVARVTLFEMGLATPCATVFAIVITTIYLVIYERRVRMSG